jgi:hypothetical protein
MDIPLVLYALVATFTDGEVAKIIALACRAAGAIIAHVGKIHVLDQVIATVNLEALIKMLDG